MTRDEFAKMINGREYGVEMTRGETHEAEKSRLLVVFGASDDLTEFRGIIFDEANAYNTTEHYIRFGHNGAFIVPTVDDNGDDIEPDEIGACIKAIFDPKEPSCTWLIAPSVPFAPFDIMEDGDLYCRGAVIAESDLRPRQQAIGVGRDADNDRCLSVSLTAPATDDDIRKFHDFIRDWSAR